MLLAVCPRSRLPSDTHAHKPPPARSDVPTREFLSWINKQQKAANKCATRARAVARQQLLLPQVLLPLGVGAAQHRAAQ